MLLIPYGVLLSDEIKPIVTYLQTRANQFGNGCGSDVDLQDLRKWSEKLTELQEELARAEWSLGAYANGEVGCSHCGRKRLCVCPNGKHRCEKCNWSPELKNFAPLFN